MANSRQAKKRTKQAEKRTKINKSRVSRIRTYVREVETAIKQGDADSASIALRRAQPEIMRGVTKGVMHRNTASRKVSRLSKRVKSLST